MRQNGLRAVSLLMVPNSPSRVIYNYLALHKHQYGIIPDENIGLNYISLQFDGKANALRCCVY